MDRDWTASFSIRYRNGTCIIILDKKYNIANSSCHFGSYGSIWTGPSPKISYGSIWTGPSPKISYNIFLVTDRSIYCHMTLSAMNYLLFRTLHFQQTNSTEILLLNSELVTWTPQLKLVVDTLIKSTECVQNVQKI
jgi:hypothetical protein